MDYKEHIRKKDGGLQAILSYKEGKKWKQKSKQGFEDSRKGKKEAKQWLRKTLDELENNLKLNQDHVDITFKEFSKMYIEDRKVNLSNNSIELYNNAFKMFSELNDIKIKDINTMHIQRCVNKLCSNCLKKGSIKTYLSRISTVFNYAVNKYCIINKSPVVNIEYTGGKADNKRALNKQEVQDLLTRLKDNSNKKYYIMSLIAVKCGLRLGEILGLTWDNINFITCKINVNKQWNKTTDKSYGFTKLKSNNSYREVPFSSEVKRELLEYRNNTAINIDNRLFDNTNKASLSGHLKEEYKKLGYDISIHELRHTYATNLIANGIDFKTAAYLLGHTVEMTMRTYSHVNSDMIDEATRIINLL